MRTEKGVKMDAMNLGDYKWINQYFTWTFETNVSSPVIISVPHDKGFLAENFSGFFEPRKNGILGNDGHTWEIVRDIMMNARVNAVRGVFPRHFLDYNRSPNGDNLNPLSKRNSETAYEDERLKIFYDYYHSEISRLVKKAIKAYGRENCLLIDFHGFGAQPPCGEFDIILGTGNRTTVKSGIDKSIAHFLSEKGYKIFLPTEDYDECRYKGGFTIHYYSQKFKIDAILMETAQRFRLLENKELGIQLSKDIAEFLKTEFNL